MAGKQRLIILLPCLIITIMALDYSVDAQGLLRDSGLPIVWIGLTDRTIEGEFRWSDGTLLNPEDMYVKWADKEPNNFLRSNCVAMSGTTTDTEGEFGQWNDIRCGINTGVICQKPINSCQEGWDDNGDFCYKVMTEQLTFEEANRECETHNAKLSSIHSEEEQAYHTAAVDNNDMRLWIGLTDAEMDGTMRYIDGTPVDYTNWALEQPDNHSGTENCVHLYVRDDRDLDGTWNDDECDKSYGFVCKKPKAPCPIGWQARDRFCYLINEEETSYEEADTACTNIGSTLTTISSADEQLFHTNVIKSMSMPLWIGLDDKVEEGTMVWKDGEQVAYTNWGNGQPDDFESNEDCIHMSKNKPNCESAVCLVDDGQWNDNVCDVTGIGYMCKMLMTL
ncbi:macrophage mannose receptor 1-like isoform X2 [Amphiura filiformis]|uniref:macrophage mannose receptor 1-like isoform X2 n=1 Tax=Amphiura filiformis TaxID=82378 RepID=UPI003B21F84F